MSPDRYFAADGARLRYRDEGTGPPLVFVHGWTLDLEMWNFQAHSLQQHFRIIRFDRRGFGLSSGEPTLNQDVADTIALCRHLNTGPIGCVGMSQGARVVLRLAQLDPRLLDCFVLDGPPEMTPDCGSGDLDYAGLKTLAQSAGLPAFRREWARHPLVTLATVEPAAHQLLEQMIARYPGRDLLSTANGPPAISNDPKPAALTQAALVLNGELDTPTRLRAGQQIAGSLPRGERMFVPGARHLCNLDNPDAYNSLLLHFFTRHLPYRRP